MHGPVLPRPVLGFGGVGPRQIWFPEFGRWCLLPAQGEMSHCPHPRPQIGLHAANHARHLARHAAVHLLLPHQCPGVPKHGMHATTQRNRAGAQVHPQYFRCRHQKRLLATRFVIAGRPLVSTPGPNRGRGVNRRDLWKVVRRGPTSKRPVVLPLSDPAALPLRVSWAMCWQVTHAPQGEAGSGGPSGRGVKQNIDGEGQRFLQSVGPRNLGTLHAPLRQQPLGPRRQNLLRSAAPVKSRGQTTS
mmetsp:Transcript_54829/g.138524  ORF Transcript_54829/g.138524 Transcript_54829/m.138524 type:complete len:245 (-) Transcript_54829:540-1274(-)